MHKGVFECPEIKTGLFILCPPGARAIFGPRLTRFKGKNAICGTAIRIQGGYSMISRPIISLVYLYFRNALFLSSTCCLQPVLSITLSLLGHAVFSLDSPAILTCILPCSCLDYIFLMCSSLFAFGLHLFNVMLPCSTLIYTMFIYSFMFRMGAFNVKHISE